MTSEVTLTRTPSSNSSSGVVALENGAQLWVYLWAGQKQKSQIIYRFPGPAVTPLLEDVEHAQIGADREPVAPSDSRLRPGWRPLAGLSRFDALFDRAQMCSQPGAAKKAAAFRTIGDYAAELELRAMHGAGCTAACVSEDLPARSLNLANVALCFG